MIEFSYETLGIQRLQIKFIVLNYQVHSMNVDFVIQGYKHINNLDSGDTKETYKF